ncbi:MAG: 3-oxoacyl-ACP reductase family protein [Candidatus Methanofastidiosia archaeon]|jgi:3-oxoacyl-[acyl-carrier protein] reductase
MLSVKGKKAVVTGSSRGIGKGCALTLAKYGADIVVNYVSSEEKAADTVKEVTELGRESFAVKADVSNEGHVKKLITKTVDYFGRIDILVNNAGIHQHLKTWELSLPDWNRVLNTNLTGVFLCSREAVIHMKEQKLGSIVNISSCVGFTGTDHEIHYASTKSGVIGFTKSLALEAAPYNVRVNAVAPGFIATDMVLPLTEKERKDIELEIPLGRLGNPEDIGEVVAFLASDVSQYITGETIHVNGGLIMY